MNVIWSKLAEDTFLEIIDYIDLNFGQTNGEVFLKEVDKVIMLIKINPFSHPYYREDRVRKAIIRKYTSMYYEIDIKTKTIFILAFHDNRKNIHQL